MVTVADCRRTAAYFRQYFGVLVGKIGDVANGGVFFENYLALGVGEDFKGVAVPDNIDVKNLVLSVFCSKNYLSA